jgi:glycosyltransferase involved in cell wall biosynthesis
VRAPRRICTVGDSFALVHRSYSSALNPARRLYHKHVEQKFRRHEKMILESFDTVVAFTERDAASIEAGGGRACKVIPNGVDERIFFPRTRPENPIPVLSFHGLLDFHPNAAAARFIVEELGPALEARLGLNGFKVQIIGARASSALRSAASVHPWLCLPGFVDDLPQMLSRSDVYLAPIFSGAGIKNKVLEAMSLGLPVVGTPEAFAALKVVDGVHCVLADRGQFADAVVACLNAREARGEIGREAAQFVDQQYRWGRVGAAYRHLYLGTAKNADCGKRQ